MADAERKQFQSGREVFREFIPGYEAERTSASEEPRLPSGNAAAEPALEAFRKGMMAAMGVPGGSQKKRRR